MQQHNDVLIYTSSDNQSRVEVRFDGDNVWLNQYQLAELFQTDRTSILKHIQNIYATQELNENSTCAKFAQVRNQGKRLVKRELINYNLDVIISIGYRVNSIRAIHFRQWATQRLKDYLVQGLSINHKRLEELGKMVKLIESTGNVEILQLSEAKGLLHILSNYTRSFILLNQYDSHKLQNKGLNSNITSEIQYGEA